MAEGEIGIDIDLPVGSQLIVILESLDIEVKSSDY